METRTLGKTGIQVSVQCLGAMMFGLWGNRDHDDSVRIIHQRARQRHQLRRHRRRVLARRVGGDRRQGTARAGATTSCSRPKCTARWATASNRQGNSRRWIRYEVEQSLRRLGTDYIDLYQIHRPDPTVEVEETLSVLTDLMHEGKVRAIGSSTFPAEEIVEAQWVAERRGYERFRCEQPPYSILARGIERAVLPDLRALRHGRDRVEPAQRRMAHRQVQARPGVPERHPRIVGPDGPARSASTTNASSTRSNSSRRSPPTPASR